MTNALKLTPYAVENLDLLHDIAAADPAETSAGLARARGEDKSNFSKRMKRLEAEGFVTATPLALLPAGLQATAILGRGGDLAVDGEGLLVAFAQLQPYPGNARRRYDPQGLADLAADIAERSTPARVGLINPLSVLVPGLPGEPYRVRAGERRRRAIAIALAAGTIGAGALVPVRLVSAAGALEEAFLSLAENLQREDLHPVDEGEKYRELTREFHVGTDVIAARIHKSRKHVQDRIALVEKLAPEVLERMFLADDDPQHLTYKEARFLMQTHRERPLLALTPKEGLTLLELAHAIAASPSPHPVKHGRDGWLMAPRGAPAGGAAASLADKGLIEVADEAFGCFLRLARGPRAGDLAAWLAERRPIEDALWSARCEVVTPVMAAELRQARRYATDWLNPPLSDPPPALPPAPPADASQASPESPPPAGAGEADPGAGKADPDDDLPTLGVDAARRLAEIAAHIALRGEAVPGAPALRGARAYEYQKDPLAQTLIFERLIKFAPAPDRRGQLVCLTDLGARLAGRLESYPPDAVLETPWFEPPPPGAATGPLAGMLGDDFAQQMRAVREAEGAAAAPPPPAEAGEGDRGAIGDVVEGAQGPAAGGGALTAADLRGALLLTPREARMVRALFAVFIEDDDEAQALADAAEVGLAEVQAFRAHFEALPPAAFADPA